MSSHKGKPGHAPTRRETQVGIALLFGHSARVTAAELGMSLRTVECHRQRLFQKFGVRRITDFVRIVMSKPQGAKA